MLWNVKKSGHDTERSQLNAILKEIKAAITGSGVSWGGITGTLSSQTDLQTALNAKQNLDAQLTDLAGLVYAGNGLKVVRVNVGETAWELATVSSGGSSLTINSRTATFTEAGTSGTVVDLCDATVGNITANLPTAVGNTCLLTIKKTDSSANTVIIDGLSTETIDGGLTATLTRQYESITLISNNTNWMII